LIAIADAKGIVFRQQTKDNAKWVEDMAIHKNGVQSLMLDNPGNLNNETLNVLTKLVTEAYENVREDMSREVSVLRDLVSELKEHKGFSKFKELTYGNQADLYKRMIKKENGDLLFRNPWEDDSLTSVERKFLKYVLEKINKDRLADVPNIEKLRDSNDVRYFRVPLAVGDMSSRASQMGGLDKAYKARLKRLNPKVWFDDMQKKLTGVFSEGQTSFERDDLFKMNNMFD
jgi:hypothetical protein